LPLPVAQQCFPIAQLSNNINNISPKSRKNRKKKKKKTTMMKKGKSQKP